MANRREMNWIIGNDRSNSYDNRDRKWKIRKIQMYMKKICCKYCFVNYIVEKVYAIKLWNCWESFILRKLRFFFFLLKLIIYVDGEWKGGVDWIIGRFVGKVRDSNGSMVNLELTSVTVPCYNFAVEWSEKIGRGHI